MADSTIVSLAPFPCNIRVDQATQQASVIDTLKSFMRGDPKGAAQAFRRLGEDYKGRCPVIRINGVGKLTPVASAAVLVEIIWEIRHPACREFRRQSAMAVCRILGADVN